MKNKTNKEKIKEIVGVFMVSLITGMITGVVLSLLGFIDFTIFFILVVTVLGSSITILLDELGFLK